MPEGYVLEKSELSKSTVNISGDDDVLNSIDKIDTEYIDISNLTSNNTIVAKLNVPDGIVLKDSNETVDVKFTVVKEEPVSKEIVGNVNYIDVPEGFILESSTQGVKVNLHGLRDQLDKVNAENIQVTVNLSDITEEGTFTYTPEVIINNENITLLSVENVEVTLKKKV